LSQVGPGAVTAGLSLNHTVGALAAFDNAGIKGSDAGTSLKTMLTRLVPQTDKAAGAMEDLGLKFTDAQGQFLPLPEIAQQLQDSFKGLSDAEKTTALNEIFGTDAARAASVLATEGAAGLQGCSGASRGVGAGAEAANGRMKGTAGAVEERGGAWETLQLRIGKGLGPAVEWASEKLGGRMDFL